MDNLEQDDNTLRERNINTERAYLESEENSQNTTEYPAAVMNELRQLARFIREYAVWAELDRHQRLPPPASKQFIENLVEKRITIASGTDVQCPVCLKLQKIDEVVKVLPCSHEFHSSCILPWLEKTNSCPMCRHELPTDDEDYEMYRKHKLLEKQREEQLNLLHNSMYT